MRLRVPEKRGDALWFAKAMAGLEQMDGLLSVQAAPTTANLILEFENGEGLDERLARIGLFDYKPNPPPRPSAAARINFRLTRLDRLLKTAGTSDNDLRSLLLLFMLILAGIQIMRGKVMVPAVSLLWYSLELVNGAVARGSVDTENADGED
jgi:hypothetical protein